MRADDRLQARYRMSAAAIAIGRSKISTVVASAGYASSAIGRPESSVLRAPREPHAA